MKTIKNLINNYLKNAKQRRDWMELQAVMDRSPSMRRELEAILCKD
jgi:hypothetical protein